MTLEPHFSVIIPTCDGERYLAAAMESVLNQTYPHLRLIVLESGSTDRTLDILHGYDDPRLETLSSPETLDMAGNWGRILDLPLEGYMTILGHDDVLYPHFLEEIARLIAAEPDASLYCTHFHFIDAAGEVRRPCVPVPYQESADEFLFARHCFQRDSTATGYVMRPDAYRRIGGFPPFPHYMYADDITWYRLSKMAYKVCSPAIAFGFRQHATNASVVVGVEPMYQAATMYWRALGAAGHITTPARRDAARRFLTISFLGHYHQALVRLIESGDPAQMEAYRAMKARILADHAEHPVFSVYDMPSRIYETVAGLPGPVRKSLLHVIRAVRCLRRWLRRQRRDALNH